MSDATQPSLIPVSSRILCSRATSRERSWICVLRYRVRFLSVRIRLGRHEAGLQQPGLEQLAEPLRILDVGLATGNRLDMTSVDERQLEVILEDRPHRLPVDAGSLHRNLLDSERLEPVPQCQQSEDRRLELGEMLGQLAVLPHAHTRGDDGLVDIEGAWALDDPLHDNLPWVDERWSPCAGAPRRQASL